MMDNKNIPAVDQSWSEAEKMLDKHFKKKRMIVLFFSIAIPAFVIGLALIIGHSKKISENNIASSAQTEVSTSSLSENTVTNNRVVSPEINNSLKSNNVTIPSNQSTPAQLNKLPESNKADQNQELSTTDKPGKKKVDSNIILMKPERISVAENPAEPSMNHNYHSADQLSISDGKSLSNQNNLEAISLMNPLFASTELNSSQNSFNEKLNINPGKDHGVSKIGWEASIYGGVNYIQKTLSVTNDWNNYLMHRKNEEDPVVAPFIGMSVSANINSLSLNLGIEYSQYGEKTNYYPYSNQSTYIDNSDWQTYLRSITDTDTAYVTGNQYLLQTTYLRLDSSYVTTSDTIEEYKYDQHIAETNGPTRIYYVEMPIEVSYRISKGKLGFGLSGGISPALRVQENGYYLRSDGRGVEALNEIKSFRTFLLNARMSVDLYYRVGDRMNLLIRPQFRTNLNSVFKEDYGVKQKYYSTGVLFGVSYMLN